MNSLTHYNFDAGKDDKTLKTESLGALILSTVHNTIELYKRATEIDE